MIWVFLGALSLVVVVMGVVAAKTDKNIIPVDVDGTWTTIAAFYRARPDPSGEVDLGKAWTSADDPGAMIALSWSGETHELVALRRQAKPSMTMLGGFFTSVPTPLGASRKIGMKVLAVAELDDLRLLGPHALEQLPDGLDRFTTLLGSPYVAPDPERFGPVVGGNRRSTRSDERRPAPDPAPTPVADLPVVLVVLRDPAVRAEVGAPRAYASGATVGAALVDLTTRKGAASVVTRDGALRDDVVIYLGDPNRGTVPERCTRDLDVALADGDIVTIDAATARRP